MQLFAQIEGLAEARGLRFLGVAPLSYKADAKRYRQWLAEGNQFELGYLERNQSVREQPASLLEGANCALVIAMPYWLGDRWEDSQKEPRVAQYARFRDYHRILRERATELMDELQRHLNSTAQYRVCVDTAPILERALAAQTKGGFVGKNTCYIHSKWGSFLLLAEILTKLEIDKLGEQAWDSRKRTEELGCGPCKACQVHCPTGALNKDFTIETSKCLSYWTIEHRGTIPYEYWPHLATYYYGCDICQLVCPYNMKDELPRLSSDIKERELPQLAEVACMTQAQYESYFGGTPMTRAKRSGLRRNALIAMTVTRHPNLEQTLKDIEANEDEPLVVETAAQVRLFLAGAR